MTQGVGQARVPTTIFPLTESPNLQEAKKKQKKTREAQWTNSNNLYLR